MVGPCSRSFSKYQHLARLVYIYFEFTCIASLDSIGRKTWFGTLMNIVFIAAAIEFGVTFFPVAPNYFVGIIYCFVGIALVGLGSTFYITCGLGPGPRDGLMTAIHNKTGVRVGRVRLAIEATVLVLGALLGGRIGLGTALFALFIGQSIAISLGVVSRFTSK